MTNNEQKWLFSAAIISVIALFASCIFISPMPLMFAFGFDAITFARMDCDV